MGKSLYIAEKPSVAQEFAKALKMGSGRNDGYLEDAKSIVTWCYGHLVTMSYPEVYDPALKLWSMDTIPFLPKEYKYEIIESAAKQFGIVKNLLNRQDVEHIYVCTDSGREGEYIYRLVDRLAAVPADKDKRRVWIDSQTEEEILRGIREAKPLSEYDNLSDAAYLRAKEDYLMGINFSRALTLKYKYTVGAALNKDKMGAIAVGRVMTCVLGMVVRREREIRDFVKTPYYRVMASFGDELNFDGEFRAVKGSKYFESPLLYKENGFRKLPDARTLISDVGGKVNDEGLPLSAPSDSKEKYSESHPAEGLKAVIEKIEKKSENKNPPLLFNLAELQNECSKIFKISPDDTLNIAQELYEKKLVTYPRTDARVLSSAVAKEIGNNLKGLSTQTAYRGFCEYISKNQSYKNINKRYVNDAQITDHYAIIPTGQGFENLPKLSQTARAVYDRIVRRFLAIFYPPAVYQKVSIIMLLGGERFFANFKALKEKGYLAVSGGADRTNQNKDDSEGNGADNFEASDNSEQGKKNSQQDSEEKILDESKLELLSALKKGSELPVNGFTIKAGETAPPSRYTSGSLILAMENAGKLIEDEELRAQIKGSGIGTSATRAEILKKLFTKEYLRLNNKTQIVTPTLQGEMIYEVVNASIKPLLNAELTASWEKGLTQVAEGQISSDDYMVKLEGYVTRQTENVKKNDYRMYLKGLFDKIKPYYKK